MTKRILYPFSALLFWLFVSVSVNTAIAQTGSLSGIIIDQSTGDPLVGTTVLITDLERGTAADAGGRYTIDNIPVGTYNIRFSYVGYRLINQEVVIQQGGNELNIEMRLDAAGLDELIVSGYATIPKREITGAIAQVRGRDVGGLDIASPDQALQGRIAGAQVSNLSGQPGGATRIRIRGIGSINAGNEPLYIVDGVPMTNEDRSGTLGSSNASNVLNVVNPRDIESIEVLKDAAASAIYGAQAANGVILITTRRGQAGNTQFNLSANYGVMEELKRLDVIEGPEWVGLQYEAFEWYGEFLGVPTWETVAANNIGGWTLEDVAQGNVPHYDWQDALMRTGTTQRYDLSASGGNEQTRFLISGGYNDTQGIARGTDMQRMNIRANIDHRATDRLSLDFSTSVAVTDQQGALQEGFYFGSPFFTGQFMRPTEAIYNEDGSLNMSAGGNYNPLGDVLFDDRKSTQKQLVGNLGALYRITDHLNFRSNWGLDYRTTEDTDYRAPESPAGEAYNGYLYNASRNVSNFTTNQVFNYIQTFDEIHNLRALAGFEYNQSVRETFTASGQGFPSGLFRTLQNAAEPFGVSGFGSESRRASFLSRVQYDYGDRYIFNASARYDGHSRFGENNRWGLFYAGSVSWRLSSESFMDFSDNWLEDLRVRVSYGITGNSAIDNFAARQLFGSGGAYAGNPALTPTSLGNPDLTWEEAATLNLGLDWALFESRVYGSLDIYQRENSMLLLDRQLPQDSGFTTTTENAGMVTNEGIELEVGAVLVDRGGFVWSSDFNVTWQRNELNELNEGALRTSVSIDGETRNLFVGHSLSTQYMYKYAGVNPADGRPMFYDRNGNITYTPTTSGDIETDDRYFVGDYSPGTFGGWYNRMNYRGFQLDVLFQFNFDQRVYNSFMGSFTDGAFYRREGLITNARNRWTQPGQITSVERAYVNSAYPGRTSGFTTSTRFLEDASYIRLKNVQLGYSLPASWTEQMGLRNARVFVQGTNLITWTNYTGVDPEVVGTNNAVYPQSRTLTTGIEIGF